MTAVAAVRQKLLPIAARLDWLPPLLARIAVGAVFARSGWGKLHNLDGVTKFFTSLGIPAPHAQAVFVASIELGCGILLIAGLLTRLASLPLIGTMVVAILTAKKGDIDGVIDLFGLQEFLLIVLLVWLAIAGAGAVSADRKLFARD